MARREWLCVCAGRQLRPSAGIIDKWSGMTCGGSGARGFDGGKMVNGRKRHIVVDTLGLVLTIGAHAAFV
jgi:hypothetical protein